MATSATVKRKIPMFSREQAEYLDKQFPERILSEDATVNQVQQYFGTRKVVQFVKDNIRV